MNDASLYDRAYFEQRHYTDDPRRMEQYRQEVKRLKQYVHSGRVLDIGCGIGAFLACLDDRFTKYGIEPSDFARAQARKKGVLIVEHLDRVESDAMDVVILRGTLQHIARPFETLEGAARVLRPGGLLVLLATPDADSLVYQLFGTLPALDPPRNWMVIGHRSLKNIIERLGFGDVRFVYPYWGTPYARPLMDALNFVLSFFKYRPFAWPGNMMEVYAVKK